jgi:Peptidase family M1 domain
MSSIVRFLIASLLVLPSAIGARSGQAGGTTTDQTVPAEQTVVLLGAVERALTSGSADAFLAVASLDRTKDDTRAFLDRWFVAGTTRATIRERDRQPMPDGSGTRLAVEVLLESGRQARLATWRMDVAPSAAGPRITQIVATSVVDGLQRLTLDPDRRYRAHNLVMTSEDVELRLPDGEVYLSDTGSGPTAAVLIGRGEMIFHPAPEAEQRQIKLFTGREELRTPFSSAFARFSPFDARARLPRAALVAAPADAKSFARASEVFAEQLPKSFGLDLADMSHDSWSLVPTLGDFLAEVDTQRFGVLTYTRAGNDAEDISVFDRARHRNISVYASKQRLAAQGRFYSEDDSAEYDVEDLQVDTTFVPSRLWLSGSTKMRLRVRAVALGALTVRLANDLTVHSVVGESIGRLLAVRVRGQNSIIVNLPTPVSRGDVMTFTISYSGRLMPQGIDRENVGVAAQEQAHSAVGLLAEPEPSYVYSNRSYWYAQSPIPDYATATIRFSVPTAFGAACSGEPAAGSPVTLRSGGREPIKLHLFTATLPIRYLGCVVSRFGVSEERNMTLPATAGRNGAPTAFPVRLVTTARVRGRAREMLDRSADITAFYSSLLGDTPFPSLTLAVTESHVPGGHAPGYLAILSQPIPTSNYVWRDDPAAFDDFPDFFVAHELAHQWWGQTVGWKNYHEQWLSEGFAQYFAVLFAEHQRGAQTFNSLVRQLSRWALETSDQGPVYLGYRLGHLRGESRIFRALVYNKGAVVLHMLRRILGDETFFRALRRFYAEHRFKKAGTDDLQRAFEAEAGRSFEDYFARWILGQDLPTITFTHAVVDDGRAVSVKIQQQGAATFEFPVTVTIVYADGSSEEVNAHVQSAETNLSVPLKKRLRAVDVNRDRLTPVTVKR